MKRLTCVLVLALVGSAFSQTSQQTNEEAKRADIRRLLKLTGAGDLGKQVATQMLGQFQHAQPGVPKKFWEEFAKEIDPDKLAELTVPIYARHLSHDDVKQLIAFHESPIGKKLIKVQPLIMQESMLAGQKWGAELGEKVARKLVEEGYQLPTNDSAPPKAP